MKTLYESLLTGKVVKPSAKVVPSSKKELWQLIVEHIKRVQPRPGQEVDFNWIDISQVDDLYELFEDTNYIPVIDKWKIDHVKDFYHMFFRNRYITRSPLPVLQEKLLRKWCYGGMFYGCTSLETAPELPATKLDPGCYIQMFENCTALKHAPELPATKLRPDCYTNMFKDCSSLKAKAKVPAEVDLNKWVAENMYAGCTNIKD